LEKPEPEDGCPDQGFSKDKRRDLKSTIKRLQESVSDLAQSTLASATAAKVAAEMLANTASGSESDTPPRPILPQEVINLDDSPTGEVVDEAQAATPTPGSNDKPASSGKSLKATSSGKGVRKELPTPQPKKVVADDADSDDDMLLIVKPPSTAGAGPSRQETIQFKPATAAPPVASGSSAGPTTRSRKAPRSKVKGSASGLVSKLKKKIPVRKRERPASGAASTDVPPTVRRSVVFLTPMINP